MPVLRVEQEFIDQRKLPGGIFLVDLHRNLLDRPDDRCDIQSRALQMGHSAIKAGRQIEGHQGRDRVDVQNR